MSLFDQPDFYNGYGNPNTAATAQNPAIVPPMDPTVGFPDANGGGEVYAFQSRLQLLTLFPRNPATGSWAFTGSVTTGDLVSTKLACGLLPGGSVTVTTLAIAGDTLATIAQRITNQLNANAILQSFGAVFTYTAPSGVPTITLKWPGPVGNLVVLTAASHAYATACTVGGTTTDADVATVTSDITTPVTNTAKIVIGGTKKTADVFSVTFEHPLLANGRQTITYTVLGGDTLALIAAGINTAIGAASALAPLGLLRNVAGTSLFLSWNAAIGQVFIDIAVSHPTGTTLAASSTAGVPDSALAPAPLPAATITVGGTPATGDLLNILITSPSMSSVRLQYTVLAGATTTTIATALKNLFNATAALTGAGFSATSVAAVVTVAWTNTIESATFTCTAAGAFTGALALTPAPSSIDVAYAVIGGDSVADVADGLNTAVNANVVLAANNIIGTVSGAVLSLHSDGLLHPAAFSGSVSGAATETLGFVDASGAGSETVTPTAPTGGAGPVIPTADFTFSMTQDPGTNGACGSSAVTYFLSGKPLVGLDYNLIAALVAQGQPIV